MLLSFYFFTMVALPLALGGFVVFNGLPRGRYCPGCTAETIRLRSPRARLLSRLLRGETLHRRWCPRCEWAGFSRIARGRSAVRAAWAGHARAAGHDGVDIRSILIDGEEWRVVLQCWSDQDHWHGRLLFVDSAGHLWPEPSPIFEGRSAVAVLSQVLALPEPALAGRIRKTVR